MEGDDASCRLPSFLTVMDKYNLISGDLMMNRLIPGMLCLALASAFNLAHAEKATPKKAEPDFIAKVNGQPVLRGSYDYLLQKTLHGDPLNDRIAQRVRDELVTQTL